MCTCVSGARALIGAAKGCTAPLDITLFLIFFIPSIGASIISFGTGMLIRAYVERSDRLQLEAYLKTQMHAKQKPRTRVANKKHRPH